MAKLKAGESKEYTEYELIPEGEVVELSLMLVEEHKFEWPKGSDEWIEKLRWNFVITEEPWVNRKIRGETSTNFVPHPNCKAYEWAKALTGVAYQDGDELDTDDLIGLKARGIVAHKPGKDGKIWEELREVLPMRRAGALDRTAPAPVDPPTESPF